VPVAFATAAATALNSSQNAISVTVENVGDIVALAWSKNVFATTAVVLSVNGSGVVRINESTVAPALIVAYALPAATGSLTVSASVVGGAAQHQALAAAVYTGVDTTTPIGSTALASGNSSVITASVASTAGSFAVAGINTTAPTATGWTTGAGVSRRAVGFLGGTSNMGVGIADVPSSDVGSTITLNLATAGPWRAFSFMLNPTGVAAVNSPYMIGWFS